MPFMYSGHLSRVFNAKIQVATFGIGKRNYSIKNFRIRKFMSITLKLNR